MTKDNKTSTPPPKSPATGTAGGAPPAVPVAGLLGGGVEVLLSLVMNIILNY